MIASSPPRRMDRHYNGLQYLRALAASMVLAVHAFKFNTFPLGLLGSGVDLFFVLSGFLMVAITDEATRPWPFLLARLRRIVPLYWLLTTAMVIVLWGAVSWRSPIPFWYLSVYTTDVPARLIAASYTFIPVWNSGANKPWPVIPGGWTLNLEMMFYVLFALSLYLPRRWQLAALTATMLTLALVGIFAPPDSPTLVAWTQPVIIDFVVGAWIGYIWQNGLNMARGFAKITVFILALSAVMVFVGSIAIESFRFVFSIPYGALLIWVLKAEARPNGIRRLSLPYFLGNASYAIYLVQFAPIAILDMHDIARGPVFASTVIIVTMITAAPLYLWVERPMLRLLGNRQPASARRS